MKKKMTKGKKRIVRVATATAWLGADIYRRVVTLAAYWGNFDPLGAVNEPLHDMILDAENLRAVALFGDEDILIDWDCLENRRVRGIREEEDKYRTIKNHIKGIVAALRRYERTANGYALAETEGERKALWSDIAEVKGHC